jgi:hypothetical protein
MTTKAPTPVDVPITVTPIGVPTSGPQSVPPGPGTTGQVPTVPTPVGPLEKAPPPVATGQTIETTAIIPVPEIPVDIATSAAITASVPKPIYIRVSSDNTVVTDNTRVLNFMGPGVSVSGTSSQANITITGSGPGGTPGGSNTQIQFNNSGLFGGTANLTFDVSTRVLGVGGSASATGNITGNYILGNGSQLTGLPATYGNSNVATLLAGFGSNTVSTTGNITAGYVLGNGSQLTGLPATYGNSNVSALLAAFGSNTLVTTGNITGSYFIGNGSQLTGLAATYGNANVAANLAVFGSNPISTTGNVTGGNITTAGLISATASITGGNVLTGGLIVATGNVTGGNLVTGGAVSASGNLSAVGNITGGNILGGANVNATTHTGATVSVTGNITGSYFIGNGSLLTGIVATSSYGNSNVAANLAAFGSNPVSTTGNVTASNFIGNVVGAGAGTPTISSATNLDLSAASAVRVIGGGTFRLPSLTTAQIANTIAANGDMIYNSSVNKFQGYEGGAWANII